MKIIENTCGKVCPVVAELRAENDRLCSVISKRDQIIDELLVQIKEITEDCDDLEEDKAIMSKLVASLRGKCAENDKRLARIRNAAFGIVDWGIED
jgi:hypothetical protein